MDVKLSTRNIFKNHYDAFVSGILSLFELELITYAWSYKHSSLWDNIEPPTEPFIRYNEKETAFKTREKNWKKSLNWIKIKNRDNREYLKEVKRFLFDSELDMLDQKKYNQGQELFETYKEPLF